MRLSTTRHRYAIDLPVFSGPFDVLLHLIERRELDVTAVSLAEVTDQYLAQVGRLPGDQIDQLIDFLAVGARLALIKSRALLPKAPEASLETAEEEDPAAALLRRLRQYRRFKEAAAWLERRQDAALRSYLRVATPPRVEARPDLSSVSTATLLALVRAALERAAMLHASVEVVEPPRVTIEDQMAMLRNSVAHGQSIHFRRLLPPDAGRVEIAVTLLAVLELVKRHEIVAVQPALFGAIEIRAALPGKDEPFAMAEGQ